MYQILIVTNDKSPFVELIQLLKKDYFNVSVESHQYLMVQHEAINQYDFILLNLDEKESQNRAMIAQIKYAAKCPLYLFSKFHSEQEKIQYLEYGGEGFLNIPFSAPIVRARIKSVLRYINNFRQVPMNVIKLGNIIIHLDNREIVINGSVVPLTTVEFKILRLLAERKDSVVSKDHVIQYVWDDESSATDNALGIHITRLRKKLSEYCSHPLIETIWGLGYRLNYSEDKGISEQELLKAILD